MTETKPVYNVNPIEQLDGEPDKWYSYFIKYYLPLGAGRSVFAAYKEYRLTEDQEAISYDGCNPNWYEMAKTWNWESRASAYDRQELSKWVDNLDDLREQVKKERIEGLLLLSRKADEGLRAKTREMLEKESTAALSQAKKTSTRELREELDGYSSKQITELEIVIRELPEPLQSALIQALNKR